MRRILLRGSHVNWDGLGFSPTSYFCNETPVNDGDETQPHISSVTDKKQQGGQAQAPCQECPMTSPCRRSLFPVSLPPTPLKNNRKSKYPQHFSQLCNRVDGLCRQLQYRSMLYNYTFANMK